MGVFEVSKPALQDGVEFPNERRRGADAIVPGTIAEVLSSLRAETMPHALSLEIPIAGLQFVTGFTAAVRKNL